MAKNRRGPRREHSPPGPKGSILRASGKDGPQHVRSEGHRWTDEAETIFLDALAASNNATWAAEQCGFSREAIYARARRDPALHEKMAAARALSHGRIEEALNREAEDFLAGKPPDPGRPGPPMTIQDAIAILRLNRQGQGSEGRRPAWPARRRTLGEVHESILAKLSALARKNGRL